MTQEIPHRTPRRYAWPLALVGMAMVLLALWRLQPWSTGDAPAASAPEATALPPAETAAAPASATASAPPMVIEPPAQATPLEGVAVVDAVADLVGRKALETFFQTDDFPRRVVATVDNLGRSHAPVMLWPVHPTAGRFMTETSGPDTLISADNSLRYTPLVLLLETVSIERAVDLYIRAYPALQKAYEDLGYPKKYFNDRLLAVIDLLLATPDVAYPVKVQLTEVKGPIASLRPWVRYEFADPDLESLAAGQKVLARVGPVNERRLKARLREFRQELVRRAAARPAAAAAMKGASS